jgi:hypothetical protein
MSIIIHAERQNLLPRLNDPYFDLGPNRRRGIRIEPDAFLGPITPVFFQTKHFGRG